MAPSHSVALVRLTILDEACKRLVVSGKDLGILCQGRMLRMDMVYMPN
jgi:hypothetical protein